LILFQVAVLELIEDREDPIDMLGHVTDIGVGQTTQALDATLLTDLVEGLEHMTCHGYLLVALANNVLSGLTP
jgi:hypothetical protein